MQVIRPLAARLNHTFNSLKNAETDRHNFIYYTLDGGYNIFKVDRRFIDNITHPDDLWQIPQTYQYLNKWNYTSDSMLSGSSIKWIKHRFFWNHNIYIYTMVETKSYEWGTAIEYKRDYNLYRAVLLISYLKSYINRHRTRQP